VRKRIVIYGMNYAPELVGVGRYTGDLGAHFASLGHEVCVITATAHYPAWAPLEGPSANRWRREVLDGVEVHRCPLYLHPQMRGFRRLLAPLSFAVTSAVVALREILRRRPHVVLAVEPTLAVAPLALVAARWVGARTVLHIQDLEVDAAFALGHLRSRGKLARFACACEGFLTARFDRVVTISNRMASRIAAKGVPASKLEVIRNWVDVDAITPLTGPSPYRQELGISDGVFVVQYAGSLGAKQGLGVLIDAARRLSGRRDIAFVIAGDGPMRGAVEAAADELGNMILLPFQPEARMRDFLGLADLHVLPQEKDAADLVLPSKLGGMLASGRRILVTAEAGTELAEFVEGCGDCIAPGDPDALAEAILRASAKAESAGRVTRRLERAHSLAKSSIVEAFTKAALGEGDVGACGGAARRAA